MPFAAILSRNHWVFDLDGTLTLPVHDFAAIRSELGVPPGGDIIAHISTHPKHEAERLFARLTSIEEELAEHTEPAPGVVSLVAHLHRRNTRMGVLTRNKRANALRILERIGVGTFFPVATILGRDEARPKPDPHGIRILADLWGVRMEQTVMVGDFLFDLQTGRAAGAATIHVDRSGAFRWPDLTDIGVSSLEELVSRLPDTCTCTPEAPAEGTVGCSSSCDCHCPA
jgi:HAD superfamily hydrolase (TIGR01509 family)